MPSSWPTETSVTIRNAILDALVDIDLKPKVEKPFINLSLGDPTFNPLLQPHKVTLNAVAETLQSGKYNGYGPVHGLLETRQAIADFYSSPADNLKFSADDIFMTNGASEALYTAISVLCKPGSNVLFPRPGFAYHVSTGALRVEDRYYNLIPEREWEVDLENAKSLIDEQTSAIVITNPSNPCGSNFSKEHILDLIAFAHEHHLPIITDEIYGEIVFSGEIFHPLAAVNAAAPSPVPVITVNGVAKRWLVPGWRLGWLAISDPAGLITFPIRKAFKDVCTITLAPCALVQGALPAILRDTPDSFYRDAVAVVERNVRVLQEGLSQVPGLRVQRPRGSLYCMVGVDPSAFADIDDEWDFVQKLVWEEAVFPVPGRCFRFDGYMRIVTASKQEDIEEACRRLVVFCERHRRKA